MGTTHCYTQSDFDYMEQNPSKRANEIGHRLPYHLQYVLDGKVNVKPEEDKEDGRKDVS